MNDTFWNDRYRDNEFAYGRAPNDFLRSVVGRIPKGPVLCLAEGEGRNAVFLASLGYEVTAVDFSAVGLKKAEELAKEWAVTIKTVVADLATYEAAVAEYSGIIAIWAHLPPAVRARVHGWVSRALRPDGVFVLEAYRPAQLALNTGGPRDAAMTMTLEGLREELSPMVLDIGRDVDREVQEGKFHSGPSATVQVLATRAT
jgi:SAM-dependent methyltransferase